MASSIGERARFDLIRYANCWEDADVLCAALEPKPGKRFLSIASGGDNSFALAAEGAAVLAADLSPAQLATVELKRAAILTLEHHEVLAFLGLRDSQTRLQSYRMLRDRLPSTARGFWDERHDILSCGVIHAGKFERYFRLFGARILPLIHRRSTISRLLAAKELAERQTFYELSWNTWRWRLLFRLFFSRFVMGRLGRDPEFFRYVTGSVAERILERARNGLTEIATHTNPFLEYILVGNFVRALPRYLEPERFSSVRDGMSRISLTESSIETAAARGDKFDGFNLSDVFEYLDEDHGARLYSSLLSQANTKARLAYWNMLAPRQCPEACRSRVKLLEDEARRLFAEDRAFFYCRFVLEEVS